MDVFLNPEEVFKNLELKENMAAAEFGCGTGVFAITLAKKLKAGRVYGLDVQEEKLSALQSRAKLEKISNIETILCDLEKPQGSTIPADSLDLVLVTNMLFQAENKEAVMEEAKRVAKPEGKILVIDWLKPAPFGPKEGLILPDQVKKIAEKLELKLKKEFPAGEYHYGLIFTK